MQRQVLLVWTRTQFSSIRMHRNSSTLIRCGPEYIFFWLTDENTSGVRIYCFLCVPKAYYGLREKKNVLLVSLN